MIPTYRPALKPHGGTRKQWIAQNDNWHYIAPMPTIIFWALVIALFVAYNLTTRSERRTMIETFWIIILLIGVAGFALQLLLYGSISF